MQKLLNKGEEHESIPIKQIFNLMKWDKLIMIWWLEGTLYEVVLAFNLNKLLELREVILSQLKLLDQLLCNLDMTWLI